MARSNSEVLSRWASNPRQPFEWTRQSRGGCGDLCVRSAGCASGDNRLGGQTNDRDRPNPRLRWASIRAHRVSGFRDRGADLCVRSAGHSAEDTRADGQRTNLNQVSPRAVDAWPYFVGPGSGRQVLQTWPIARPQFSVRTSQRPMPRVTPSPAKRRLVNRTRAAAGEGWGEGHTDTASFRLYDSTLSCSPLSAPGRRVRAKWPPPSFRIDCSTLSDLLSRPQAAA